MSKIFTIGFSGKSPDAFMDVLNAVRVRAVWDIRLWRTSTYVPFYSGDNLAATLGTRYEYHPEFAPTSEILAGYKDGRITWPDYERMYRELLAARRPADQTTLTAFACYARKNRHYNATAALPPNILHRIFPTSTLCIFEVD